MCNFHKSTVSPMFLSTTSRVPGKYSAPQAPAEGSSVSRPCTEPGDCTRLLLCHSQGPHRCKSSAVNSTGLHCTHLEHANQMRSSQKLPAPTCGCQLLTPGSHGPLLVTLFSEKQEKCQPGNGQAPLEFGCTQRA